MNKRSITIKKSNAPILPIIGEEIRLGDTLIVNELRDLRMTSSQLIKYFILLDDKGIILESITEPYINSNTKEGKALIECLKVVYTANKYHLSENSKGITNSGRKKDSYVKSVEAEVLGMWAVTHNKSEIARVLGIERNTVTSHLKRNKLIKK